MGRKNLAGTESDRDVPGDVAGADAGAGDATVLASDGLPDRSRDDGRTAGVGVFELPLPPDAVPALGPGDDDPRSPVKGEALPALPPLGPGDGVDAHEGYEFIAPAAAGPGDAAMGPRNVVRILKRT